MLSSRGIIFFRALKQFKSNNCINSNLKQQIRNSSGPWVYRAPMPPPSKRTLILAELAAGLMWWWIFWHLWHDYEHITGEFEYPDPTKWTNAELGIPPDDYEE